MATSYLDHRLDSFLDLVAAREPSPGGGSAAAVTASLAASLVAMAARYSTGQLPVSGQLAEEADRLRLRAASLVDIDAEAYRAVISAFGSTEGRDPTNRRDRIRSALQFASEVPLEVTEIAAQTAWQAALLTTQGKHDVRGDAATGLMLADAAARSAAHLVAVNVEKGECDQELVHRAQVCVNRAHDAVRGVQATLDT